MGDTTCPQVPPTKEETVLPSGMPNLPGNKIMPSDITFI